MKLSHEWILHNLPILHEQNVIHVEELEGLNGVNR